MTEDEREEEIAKTISEINSPVVRHRLLLFNKELDNLIKKYGKPNKVVLEFVREDFMGKKKRDDYIKQIEKNKKKRAEAKEELRKIGFNKPSEDLIKKMLLFREQEGWDYYSLKKLELSKIEEYDIDHIIPHSKGDQMHSITLY